MMSFCGHWSVFLRGSDEKQPLSCEKLREAAQRGVCSLSKHYSQILPLVHVHLTRQRARQFGV